MTTYTIKQGKHYCNAPWWQRLLPLYGRGLNADFKIDASAWYSRTHVLSSGKNKLLGRSYGAHHHTNSLRLAWQPDFKNAFEFKIYLYWYIAGERKERYLCTLSSNVAYKVKFRPVKMSTFWAVEVVIGKPTGEELHGSSVFFKKISPWGWQLFPYFGGKDTACQKMEFYLKIKS